MTDLFDDVDLPRESVRVNLDTLERDWSEGNFDDPMDAVRNAQRTIPKLIAELRTYRTADGARPSANGHGYEVACFACGKKFHVKRRPIPGRRSWCETCKAAGEPAAQRARDYRSRKSENGGTI